MCSHQGLFFRSLILGLYETRKTIQHITSSLQKISNLAHAGWQLMQTVEHLKTLISSNYGYVLLQNLTNKTLLLYDTDLLKLRRCWPVAPSEMQTY